MSTLQWIGHTSHGREPSGLLALIGEWSRRLRERGELAQMCERSLRDIGLSRYDAFQEVKKPFWRA